MKTTATLRKTTVKLDGSPLPDCFQWIGDNEEPISPILGSKQSAIDWINTNYKTSNGREMKRYYYCKEDGHGQRTGIVEHLDLAPEQINTNRYGDKYFGNKFLFDDEQMAIRAALS